MVNQRDDQQPGRRTWTGRPFPVGSIDDRSGTNSWSCPSAKNGVEQRLVDDDRYDLPRLLENHMATRTLDGVRYHPLNRQSRVGRPMSAVVEPLGPT